WNEIATTTFTADPTINFNPLAESRIYAMTHAAIHDALNAIDLRYQPYAFSWHPDGEISPEAAVTAAAYRVLIHELPNQQAVLDAEYAAALNDIPDGEAKTRGIALGQTAAAAIIALRSDDGSTAQVPYTPGTEPGEWRPTPGPPDFLPAFAPGWGQVTPFTLRRGAQFRPAPSAYFNLTSGAYTNNYNEVKSLGSVNSTTRTSEQSEIAMFWYENSPTGWNRIARNASAGQGLDLWQNARLFGLLNLALADGYVSSWDAKYFYNFWRPVTAIRAGDQDGNPSTVADPEWTSFLFTPPLPDNSSGHAVEGAVAAEVLARFFSNDQIPFTTSSGAPFPGIIRSFSSFSQAAQENADSRIYAGIHFRAATEDGLKQGEKIGRYVFRNFLTPVRGQFD
ncbi:MAG: phosphatase PAP2 family protein, partial [Acidobacteriota bacterium]|nr:phosphatase PAP2 family protein [Acidobacteriota bacterium]